MNVILTLKTVFICSATLFVVGEFDVVAAQPAALTWCTSSQIDIERGTANGTAIIGARGGAVRIAVPIVNTIPHEIISGPVPLSSNSNAEGRRVGAFQTRDWIYARVLYAGADELVDSLVVNDGPCGRDTRCEHVAPRARGGRGLSRPIAGRLPGTHKTARGLMIRLSETDLRHDLLHCRSAMKPGAITG